MIATASNDFDKEICLSAGANQVVNHKEEDWGLKAVEVNNGHKFDRLIDVEFGQNLDNTLKTLKTGAIITTYSSSKDPQPKLPFLKMMYMDLTVRLVIVYAMPDEAKMDAISDITDALKKNKLSHRIMKPFSLNDIVSSHELIESGTSNGCVLINIDYG